MPASRSFGLCAAVVVLASSAGRLAAEPYRDANLHYALELPEEWEEMTPDELSQMRAIVREGSSTDLNFTAGFRPRNTPAGSYPYVSSSGGR